jgi:hypothetical protein
MCRHCDILCYSVLFLGFVLTGGLPVVVCAPPHVVETILEAHASKADMAKGEKGVPVEVAERPVENSGNVLKFTAAHKTGSGK